jgi:hypothetical protein
MSPDNRELKVREEAKRDAVLGPAERWRLIMAAITWGEAQPQVRRNTPARCRQRERARLAALAEADEPRVARPHRR